MKIHKIWSFLILVTVLAGCGIFNKSKKWDMTVSESETVEQPMETNAEMVKPLNGVYPPGAAEVEALKPIYGDITLKSLQQGHQIYASGACTNCHKPKNIYNIDPSNWDNILTNMASKAKLNEVEKDAVNKYVLSVKATK